MKTPLLFLFLASFLFWGCYTPKKAENDLIKAQIKYPAVAANFARTFYPAVSVRDTVTHIDTAYRYAAIDCDTTWIVDTLRLEAKPQLPKAYTHTKFVAVPAVTVYRDRIVRDTAENALTEYRLQACEEEKQEWIKKADNRSTHTWWLIVALAVSIIMNLLQLKKL